MAPILHENHPNCLYYLFSFNYILYIYRKICCRIVFKALGIFNKHRWICCCCSLVHLHSVWFLLLRSLLRHDLRKSLVQHQNKVKWHWRWLLPRVQNQKAKYLFTKAREIRMWLQGALFLQSVKRNWVVPANEIYAKYCLVQLFTVMLDAGL